MTQVSATQATHTTFSLTLALSPGLPDDEDLTYSVMDGISEAYLHGLQEYLAVLGLQTAVKISMQRCDYVSDE